MKIFLLILSLAFTQMAIAASLPTIGSGQTIDLRAAYDLRMFNNRPLSANYELAQAKAKYPNYWTWITFHGATDAQAMSVNEVAVAWNEAVWSTDGYVTGNVQGADPRNGCQSRSIIDASGIYYFATQVPLTLAHGQYLGGGTGNSTELTNANGGPGTTGGTQIVVDHSGWLKDAFPDRNLLQSSLFGDNSSHGYSESFVVRGFRLDGGWADKPHDPSFRSSGVAIWDSGETSRVEYVFSLGFNDAGFHNVRGTPSTYIGCSAFSNRRYGFWLDGSSLGTTALYSPSGDDNGPDPAKPGALIGGSAGFDRPGGGTLVISAAKSETNNLQGRQHGNQKLLDLTGAWNVVVNGAWVFSKTPQAEVISIDFQNYPGGIDVRGLEYAGFTGVLKLTANGKTTVYNGPGDYQPVSFVANETGMVWSSRKLGK